MDIGIDIIEIKRIKNILDRNKFFLNYCFSNDEIQQIVSKKSVASIVAARFCAKESFFKCIGEGIKKAENFKLIKILNSKNGIPKIILGGYLRKKYKNFNFQLSLSHCREYACAVVIKENKF